MVKETLAGTYYTVTITGLIIWWTGIRTSDHGRGVMKKVKDPAQQDRFPTNPIGGSRSTSLTPRVLRQEEIHVVSDAIAKVMADGPHTI